MTAISRRRFVGLGSMFFLARTSGVFGGTAETPGLQRGVFIFQSDFDHPCEILDAGDRVAFRNERGDCTWGRFINSTGRVEVTAGKGWDNAGGVVTDDGNVIKWDS